MAESAPSIPILTAPPDTLREPAQSLKQAALAPHPVTQIQATALHNEWEAKLFMTERVYGAHAAWEQRMDRAALAQTRRLPGVPSAHIGLDHVLGLDDRIDFCDVLGLPENCPRPTVTGVHDRIERDFNLKG